MKFATVFALLTLTTAVTAEVCLGGCMRCRCGEIAYDIESCRFGCRCNGNTYKSTDPDNTQGNCDQPGGFRQVVQDGEDALMDDTSTLLKGNGGRAQWSTERRVWNYHNV
ncbi:hypothetical protein QIS74_02168 [Colletotrichum tabaci]|uniref:Uncharacterized protein n=1 Tax=Colletotrichum tabaci TaxID=1209068 RepID=A0AAV9TRD4_9PEZI